MSLFNKKCSPLNEKKKKISSHDVKWSPCKYSIILYNLFAS